MKSQNNNLTRRNFLKKSSLFGTGVLVNTGRYFQVKKKKSDTKDLKMKYRILGKSGLKISEIGLGTWEAPNENVLSYALDRGINYLDTAPEYKNGEEERMVGKVLKKQRDKAIVGSKIFTTSKTTKKETVKLIDGLLKRMQTDYVDVLFIYQVGAILPKHKIETRIERLKNDNVIEAFRQAKKDGKVRALGISSHGGDLVGYTNFAIDILRFDVIMLKYNFMAFPEEKDILKKAKENNVGSIAFKIAGGAYDQKIKGYEKSRTPEFRRAAIKWTLSNPNLTNCIMRMPTFDEVDNCIIAVNEEFGYLDRRILEKYAEAVKPYYCRSCNKCVNVCPNGVAIPEIQRYLMYYTNFQHKETAVERYTDLQTEQKADRCVDCTALCERICPNRIPIKVILTEAHRTLTS